MHRRPETQWKSTTSIGLVHLAENNRAGISHFCVDASIYDYAKFGLVKYIDNCAVHARTFLGLHA